ncbi:MAG: WD40 repeat domain-containing protein, partial [Chloroflexota bacterium]
QKKTSARTNIKVENITDVSGEVNIAGGDIYKGFTAEQVSVLITQISTTFQPKKFDGRCPYKGLDVFEEEDSELFFGREKLVEDLVSRVKESRTVFITGPSGSGKSSLVRAGLIPALKNEAIKNSHQWLYATLKPGRDPFEALASAFSRVKSPELGDYFQQNIDKPEILHKCAEAVLSERSDQRLALFIDQFEEVFTQLSADKAGAFIEMLAQAATIENGRMIILFSMRSDFVSNCATYPKLNALLNQQFVQIGAMQPAELVSAIAQPALRVGLQIDPDLIAQIIRDMKGEPDALPLVEFALKDLFDAEQAKGELSTLTLAAYLQRGGIDEALKRHADESFNQLNGHEQELARSIFGGLIEVGRGTQDTKRTAFFNDLIPSDSNQADVQIVIQKLANARLITISEQGDKDTVTISHEKLIDAWPWLRKLINENRGVIALQNEIAADAKEWEECKRDASYLYTGARLINAREQLETKKLVLSGLAQEYVRTGIARQKRGQVVLIGGLSAIIILLITAVIVFARLTNEAQKQAKIARAGELAAQSVALRDKNFRLSLLLGIAAYQGHVNIQSEGTLLDNAQAHPQLRTFLSGHTSGVLSVAFSPIDGGKTLASGSGDGTVILWDVATGKPIGQPLTGHASGVSSVAFSPDGKTLASGNADHTVILWDIATGKPIGQPLTGHTGWVFSVAFSPDGKTLASGSVD